MKQFLLRIYLCMSIHVLLHAQDFAQGDEPWPMPEKRIEQPIIEPSRPGHVELTMAYRRDAEEQAYARAQAQEQEAARYRDMPTREEAESEGETYWDRQENLRKERERRLSRERSTRAQKLSQEYYAQTMPKVREEMRAQELQQEQAARVAKEKAYTEYYANLSPQQRAQEEVRYEEQLQAFEQRANQEYQETVRTIEQEKKAAQALSNILRSAQIEEQQNELLAKAAEKAARTAAFLENIMQMTEREVERASRIATAKATEQAQEEMYQADIRTARSQAFLENIIQMAEREGERASRIASAREREEEWKMATQEAKDAERAVEQVIKSSRRPFDKVTQRLLEDIERQLESSRIAIEKKEKATTLQVKIEEETAEINQELQKAQEETDKRAKHSLEKISDAVAKIKQDINDPTLQQTADTVTRDISKTTQAIDQNRGWKEQVQQVAIKAQAWMEQVRAWVSAQVGAMPSLAPGVVGPEAGRDISIKLRGGTEPFELGIKQKIASELAKKYRQTVKEFDKRKIWRANSGYENLLQRLIDNFKEIRNAIQTNSALKREVTISVVPLLVRFWRGENVLMDYIDDYLTKLDAELASVIYSQTPKFAGLIGSGS